MLWKSPLLGALVLVFLASGCVVYSQNPLSPPGAVEDDGRLVGLWVVEDDGDDVTYAHIRPLDDHWMGVVLVNHDTSRRELNVLYYRAFRSRIDDRDFLNVKAVVGFDGEGQDEPLEDHERAFVFVRYTVSDDGRRLVVETLDSSPIEAIVEAGGIEGQMIGGDVLLSDQAPKLVTLVRMSGGAFEELWTLTRVSD